MLLPHSLRCFLRNAIILTAIVTTLGLPAAGQSAYWSLQGDFENPTDLVRLSFDLDSSISSSELFYGATFSHSGGINAAGESIAGGGFDPVLTLYDVTSGSVLCGQNDDGWGNPADLDARLTWPADTLSGGSLLFDPLPAGDYELELSAFASGYPGGVSPWAMDLFGPWLPVTATGISTVADATVRSLKFGSEPGGQAWVTLDGPELIVSDALHVGTDGIGRMNVPTGTALLTPGSTIVGSGGQGLLFVDGVAAIWEAGAVAIGNPMNVGSGEVTISDQAQVTSGDVTVGANAANGTLLIDGSTTTGLPSQWDATGSLTVGSGGLGSGSVTLRRAAIMTVSQDALIRGSIDAGGTVTVESDSEWNVTGELRVANYGELEFKGGEIRTGSFFVESFGEFTHEDDTLVVEGGTFEMELGTLSVDGSPGGGTPTIRLENGAVGTVEYASPGTSGGTGNVIVGRFGEGRLEVVDGSVLTSGAGWLGYDWLNPGDGYGTALVEGNGARWEITAEASSASHHTFALLVGENGSAALDILAGGQLIVHSSSAGIGIATGVQLPTQSGSGVAVVDGMGSLLRVENDPLSDFGGRLSVGAWIPATGTTGSLTVSNGGRVEAERKLTVRDLGTVTLTSDGTIQTGSFLVEPGGVFTHDDGTLTVVGGTFDPNSDPYVVNGATSSDLPVVSLIDGATASLPVILVGETQRGRLEVLSGSQIDVPATSNVVLVGQYLGSQGTVMVAGQGSALTTNAGLVVGNGGFGELFILDGGSVSDVASPVEPIGDNPDSQGLAVVSGKAPNGTPSSWTTNGELQVGNAGTGELIVADGGRVFALDGAAIAADSHGTGVATVTGLGSRWDVTDSLYVGGSASGNGGEGTLVIAEDALVVADHVVVRPSGVLQLDRGGLSTIDLEIEGQLQGKGAIVLAAGQAVTNRGLVSPGFSIGVITVSGGGSTGYDYIQQATGSLFVEIGGTSPQQYDRLDVVAGAATLSGELEVVLADLGSGVFQPSIGDSFAILTAADGFGGTTFTSRSLPPLSRLQWYANYTATSLLLEVYGTGDFDLDGDYDCIDINALTAAVVAGATNPLFDLNGDGSLTPADVEAWRWEAGEYRFGPGRPYLPGDANLDGFVNVDDFDLWNANKFNMLAEWCGGDFNADGAVDLADLNIWNNHKFTSSFSVLVPEPGTLFLTVGTFFLLASVLRRSKELGKRDACRPNNAVTS